jgi:cation diffusion facilitator CzcD-associated flavoprotein CzcO
MSGQSGKETDFEAIIVGAGLSGIASAYHLQTDLDLRNVKIFERDETWGGTWLQNQYPGCGCDIPTRLYSFSFAQRANWKRFFSSQNEILEYIIDVAQRFGLQDKAQFRTEVVSATFDEKNAHWIVKTRDLANKDAESIHTARLLFSCVGALSIPRKCDVPGVESFEGPLFHSARWRKDVNVADKNVVILGNGCTASQIVPAIAPHVKSLTQIVRAKHWYLPHFRNPFEGSFWVWLQRRSPLWCSIERFMVVLLAESHFLQAFKTDGKAARDRVAARSKTYIRTCAPKEYHNLLIPEPGELEVACKRRIFDSTYVPTLARPNVELTNDQAAKIVKDGVILKSGRKIPADVILLANGFQTDKFALQTEIKNGDGLTLEKYWKEVAGAPQAYRTCMCAPFPNMFIIWGPNAATGHFSAIWGQERAVEMAMRILRPVFLTGDMRLSPLKRSRGKSIRVQPMAENQEQEFIQDAMTNMIFSTGCGSWYVDEATGRVTAVNPSFQTTVAWRSKFPVFGDFDYRGISRQEAWKSWSLGTRIGSALRLGSAGRKSLSDGRIWTVRFALLPFWAVSYLLGRIAIRMLQALSWFIDLTFPYNRPQPLPNLRKGYDFRKGDSTRTRKY